MRGKEADAAGPPPRLPSLGQRSLQISSVRNEHPAGRGQWEAQIWPCKL